MSLWRALRGGVRSLVRRETVEQELDEELRHYLQLAVDEKVRAGMSRDAAERAARLEMGGVDATKARVRWSGWEGSVETLRQDVRYAARGLRRTPGFALIVIVTLALGIGANTAMFSVVNAVMLRPLPYREPGRLTLIWTDDTRRGLHREATAYLTITDWRAQNHTFQDLAFYATGRIAPMSNDPGGERGRSRNALVSPNLFGVLGVSPLMGRVLTRDDNAERAPVAVISYGFWQRWFAGVPDILGRTLTLDGDARDGSSTLTIVGVMPAGFYFPDKLTEVWTPATTYWRFARESTERFPDWARRWTAVGRLRTGSSIADARMDLGRIGRQLAATYPSTVPDFPGFAATVAPVLDYVAGPGLQSALWLLLGAVSLVLLVACANVANLLLARGATRQQEFAVRRALGAGRGRLVRQLAVESALLVLAGGVAGILVAAWATRLIGHVTAAYLPRVDEITTDARVLVFAALASAVAGLAFGIVPALRLSATDANAALRDARGTTGIQIRRSRGVLIVAECSLAMILLAGAGLLLKSLDRLTAVDPGYDPRGVLTLRLEFASETPPTAEERLQTSQIDPARARAREQRMNDLIASVQRVPGVQSVGFIDDLFISGQGRRSITIPGRDADQVVAGEINDAATTPEFFAAMRVPLVSGRYPTRDDAAQKIRALWSPVVTDMSFAGKERLAVAEPVVVNQAFVKRFFSGQDPLGKRFCIDPTNKTYWYVIVGVVGDMRRQGLDHPPIPEYIGPYFPSPSGRADLVVRTQGNPLALASLIRAEVRREWPSVRIASVQTVDAQLGAFSAQRRLQTWLLAAFATMALLLAAVGIFGLVHYAVSERTREIGVRVALGATPGNVLRMVVAQGMRMPLIGIAIGVSASTGLTRIMAHLLYEVAPTDVATFLEVAGLLGFVGLIACFLAGRQATAVDPVKALRA